MAPEKHRHALSDLSPCRIGLTPHRHVPCSGFECVGKHPFAHSSAPSRPPRCTPLCGCRCVPGGWRSNQRRGRGTDESGHDPRRDGSAAATRPRADPIVCVAKCTRGQYGTTAERLRERRTPALRRCWPRWRPLSFSMTPGVGSDERAVCLTTKPRGAGASRHCTGCASGFASPSFSSWLPCSDGEGGNGTEDGSSCPPSRNENKHTRHNHESWVCSPPVYSRPLQTTDKLVSRRAHQRAMVMATHGVRGADGEMECAVLHLLEQAHYL